MKLNENTVIYGRGLTLIPYCKEHVPKYHNWMEDEEIQKTTATEPQTLEEEYENQSMWLKDEDKLMFIIAEGRAVENPEQQIQSMIGDVNLIYNEEEKEGEINVMIGEPSARRKGLAIEAIKIMLTYAYDRMPLKRVFAKIGDDNEPSIRLFKNKLNFLEESYCSPFKEFTFALENDELEKFMSSISRDTYEVQKKQAD
ncbi:unnamed protein product [Auanema sp. JU1783]|nr:unnamed protein product [Auanema sp. JU1783]